MITPTRPALRLSRFKAWLRRSLRRVRLAMPVTVSVRALRSISCWASMRSPMSWSASWV